MTEQMADSKSITEELPTILTTMAGETQAVSGRLSKTWQFIRWSIFSVYRRLFSLIILANLAMIAVVSWRQWKYPAPEDDGRRPRKLLADILTATSSNITAAIICRNEHFVNLLFRIFVIHTSPKLPLWIRVRLAKVYCFGGVHSGCGIASLCWYLVFVGVSIYDYVKAQAQPHFATHALTGIICVLLLAITIASLPAVRVRFHDYFEITHRFCGWLVLAGFWLQTILLCFDNAYNVGVPVGSTLLRLPSFWMLIVITICVVYPWIRLRRVKVTMEKLSSHAIQIHFNGGQMEPCRTIRVSHNPLMETHSFATIPEPQGGKGYSMVVSRAGDWTSKIIENPQQHLWVKGTSTWGVLRVATMFKPVLIVATGSGIGPCLGLFNGIPNLPCRILWSAKSPEETYGSAIINIVYAADPKANIIDTTLQKARPNMLRLTKDMYLESKAEAVCVISNPKLTKGLVYDLECEGIPVFAPIWDS